MYDPVFLLQKIFTYSCTFFFPFHAFVEHYMGDIERNATLHGPPSLTATTNKYEGKHQVHRFICRWHNEE